SADGNGGSLEFLPDGTCDVCEPDEAPCAVLVCEDCGFSFCQLHAEEHSRKYRTHRTAAFVPAEEGEERRGQPAESSREGTTEASKEVGEEACKLERKKCAEHEQDLSLYCKEHEEIICVLCAVQAHGCHRGHKILSWSEKANQERVDLKAAMLEMVERLKFKCADPKVTQSAMKLCIQQEFDKVRQLVCKEEKRALHLVDLQEALATAHTTEVLAEIDVRMKKLMTEMAELTRQLNTFNELAMLKPEYLFYLEGPGASSDMEESVVFVVFLEFFF
uniref:Tripartite motif containing 44 n=1 Tax=Salvator merianae TaxID=96440 RepID=A0A8D0BBJ1_SALMN